MEEEVKNGAAGNLLPEIFWPVWARLVMVQFWFPGLLIWPPYHLIWMVANQVLFYNQNQTNTANRFLSVLYHLILNFNFYVVIENRKNLAVAGFNAVTPKWLTRVWIGYFWILLPLLWFIVLSRINQSDLWKGFSAAMATNSTIGYGPNVYIQQSTRPTARLTSLHYGAHGR